MCTSRKRQKRHLGKAHAHISKTTKTISEKKLQYPRLENDKNQIWEKLMFTSRKRDKPHLGKGNIHISKRQKPHLGKANDHISKTPYFNLFILVHTSIFADLTEQKTHRLAYKASLVDASKTRSILH